MDFAGVVNTSHKSPGVGVGCIERSAEGKRCFLAIRMYFSVYAGDDPIFGYRTQTFTVPLLGVVMGWQEDDFQFSQEGR